MWLKANVAIYEFPVVKGRHQDDKQITTTRYINTDAVAFAEDGVNGVFLRMNDGSLLEARDPAGKALTWPEMCAICRARDIDS